MNRNDSPLNVTWCEGRTNAQMWGASWASSSQGCNRKATETVNGKHLCWQHARIERGER